MKIGSDVSIAECRRSGYVVMEFKVKELFPVKGVLDKERAIEVSVSNPKYWTDSGTPQVGCSYHELYVARGVISFEAAEEIFKDYGASIKSFCDFDSCPIEFENPDQYDFLRLLETIEGYSGLYTWGLDET